MGPVPNDREEDDEEDAGGESEIQPYVGGGEGEEEQADGAMPNFADLLGPDCVIKRVDKDKNVICGAKPEEMQHELMTRASAQKRVGACADHVKDMGRDEKLRWSLDLKDRANEFFYASNFEEASKLYTDCLVALDLDGTTEENDEVKYKLQLPVCTNLAACMVEMGRYTRCIEICEIALSVDPHCPKALYRRGLANYRLGDHATAAPDLEAAYKALRAERQAWEEEGCEKDEEQVRSHADLERRVVVYLGHIRRFSTKEKEACKNMFAKSTEKSLYEDRQQSTSQHEVDDSDEAIEAELARIRGRWFPCCCCRRQDPKAKTA